MTIVSAGVTIRRVAAGEANQGHLKAKGVARLGSEVVEGKKKPN